jgi:CheY-like chemotaxis protein
MNKTGEIILVDDDFDDVDIFTSVYEQLNYSNKLVVFENGLEALNYLKQPDSNPFMIISDINMPMMNGFQLREHITSDKTLNAKCIPYIFLTTSDDEKSVEKAYGLSVHGYFRKDPNFRVFREKFKHIMDYWFSGIVPPKKVAI